MLSTQTSKDQCPFCGYKVDHASSLDGKHRPSEGDISLCLSCAQILIFDEDLKLREPTPEEYKEASAMEGVKKAQRVIKMLDRSKVGKR
jgi:hypothetical protein